MSEDVERCGYCGAWKHVDVFCLCPDGLKEYNSSVRRIAESMRKP